MPPTTCGLSHKLTANCCFGCSLEYKKRKSSPLGQKRKIINGQNTKECGQRTKFCIIPHQCSKQCRCTNLKITFSSRKAQALEAEESMTCMSSTSSSPSGRGRVTSSATSFVASSNWAHTKLKLQFQTVFTGSIPPPPKKKNQVYTSSSLGFWLGFFCCCFGLGFFFLGGWRGSLLIKSAAFILTPSSELIPESVILMNKQ